MGATFSMIDDTKKRNELRSMYDASLAMMIVNIVPVYVVVLLTAWFQIAGIWIQTCLTAVSVAFSVYIYRLSLKHGLLATKLNRVQFYLSFVVFGLALIGAIVTQVFISSCLSDSEKKSFRSKYYDDYYSSSFGRRIRVFDMSCAYVGRYFFVEHAEVRLAFNLVAVPILGFIHMVIFSIQCSNIWKYAVDTRDRLLKEQNAPTTA